MEECRFCGEMVNCYKSKTSINTYVNPISQTTTYIASYGYLAICPKCGVEISGVKQKELSSKDIIKIIDDK